MDSAKVVAVYDSFPADIRHRLMELRQMVLSEGIRIDPVGRVEETVKWGQPSYATMIGSSVRLGWSNENPDSFAIYFHCQSKLVSTFRELFPDTFNFEGNRAIRFNKNDRIPTKELARCIELAHSYHRRKNIPLLGAEEIKDTKKGCI